MTLDARKLTKGNHKLTIEVVDADPKAKKKSMPSIDTIELKEKK